MSGIGKEKTELAVGLIGVGLVGSAIAARLTAAGKKVFGFDVAPIESNQVVACSTTEEVFQNSNCVFLSLPTSEIVSGALAEVSPFLAGDHLVIDTTTGAVDDALRHERLCADDGAAFVEATIAGSSELLGKGSGFPPRPSSRSSPARPATLPLWTPKDGKWSNNATMNPRRLAFPSILKTFALSLRRPPRPVSKRP